MAYVIAEIGINHNGDFNLAKELMLESKEAGCDAVKFQKRTVDLVYTQEELNRFRESPWGKTNRRQKEGLEFNIDQYVELEKYASELGVDFIVSCWDLNSVNEVEKKCNIKFHKVASAMATDRSFLERLNETGRPVILSTGMCTSEQIKAAVNILDNVSFILACTSTYPTKVNEVNLRHIQTLKQKYPNKKIGFSNHYNGLDACVGAIALGAECIEFHVTKDRAMYGSDQAASIQNISYMVEAIKNMEKMVGDGIKRVYESEFPIARKLRKTADTLRVLK